MKIILMSDSHGRNQVLDYILEKHSDADVYLHCGDIECSEFEYPQIHTVKGNNDCFGSYPETMKIKIGNHKALMMHSHLCYGDRYKTMSDMAKKEGCDLVFFGHTHVANDSVINGVRLINPGSLYYARDGREISYCILDIEDEVHVDFQFAPFE